MIEMVMNQLIIFHKSNKKVRSEKMMDYLISQPKPANSFSPFSKWSLNDQSDSCAIRPY